MISRRDFLRRAAAAGLTVALPRPGAASPSARPVSRALFVYGGWPGHQPEAFRDRLLPWFEEAGFEVAVSDSLDAYLDQDLMAAVDVVVQLWTMGTITREQAAGLLEAVKSGTGLAGWHGGLCDAFREHTEYQYMTGGQWVAHPGGKIDYDVHIVDPDDPITAGLSDFHMTGTEQYYMHVDPANRVLATTTFSGEHDPWIDGAVMPVVWKKRYGRGRVFYSSIGHQPEDFDVPEVWTLTTRGILWASRSKQAAPEHLVQSVYPGR